MFTGIVRERGRVVAAEQSSNGAASSQGALPNLIVVGSQKCGTSGLHYYLGLHPEVSMSRPKELNFFIEERNWSRGVDWYQRHFDPSATIRGESSPNYTAYPQHMGVPERMASLVPDARLIYIVRDPLARIAAHWVHNFSKRREKGDLKTTLMHPNTSYLVRSQYHMQLQQFLRYFDREQILVFQQSDLRDDRTATLRRVFEFVGVDPLQHISQKPGAGPVDLSVLGLPLLSEPQHKQCGARLAESRGDNQIDFTIKFLDARDDLN